MTNTVFKNVGWLYCGVRLAWGSSVWSWCGRGMGIKLHLRRHQRHPTPLSLNGYVSVRVEWPVLRSSQATRCDPTDADRCDPRSNRSKLSRATRPQHGSGTIAAQRQRTDSGSTKASVCGSSSHRGVSSVLSSPIF